MLPEPGDVSRAFEIRLMQPLLSAFQDPDWYFVGSGHVESGSGFPVGNYNLRQVFDRTIKWLFPEVGGDFHGEWTQLPFTGAARACGAEAIRCGGDGGPHGGDDRRQCPED